MGVNRAYHQLATGQLHYRHNYHHNYHHSDASSRPPLLLLHQSPSDSAMYESLMAELGDAYWLIAPDYPGFGGSDALGAGFTMTGCAQAILDLLDSLGIGNCDVFGHHTGGAVALALASARPTLVRRLAMCGPPLLDDALRAAMPASAAAFPESADGAHLLSMWQRMAAKEGDTPATILLREVISAFNAGDDYQRAYQAVMEQDIEQQLREFAGPVLVFAGTADILYPQLQFAFSLLQDGSLAEIAGAGGYVCDRHAAAVAGLLRDFFNPS